MRGIRCQDDTLAGPAVLLWQGSSDTLVERNTIIDSSRGDLARAVGSSDHTGGIVRNNFIRWNPARDVRGRRADLHHLAEREGAAQHRADLPARYANAVEARFSGTTGVEVRNNLLDAAVAARDGATILSISGNVTARTVCVVRRRARPATCTSLPQRRRRSTRSRVSSTLDDFDGLLRPTGAGLADRGADELGRCLFCDGFETGGLASWSASSSP